MEFIDKVESTIETLEELDNFYSKLGNNPEFSHIVDAWPQEGFESFSKEKLIQKSLFGNI